MPYTAVKSRLDAGNIVILDGGTGTELERRGVKMNPDAWCGPATLENLDILEGIHRDYIEAGADVITANTYASSRLMLGPAGLGDTVQDTNRAADRVAIKARDKSGRSDVAVAGSLSHMMPMQSGSSASDEERMPSIAEVEEALTELATIHKEEGCDLIVLEMLYRPVHLETILRTATATGLPVWAGFACRRADDGTVLSFEQNREIPFSEIVSVLKNFDVAAAGIMHTPSNLIADAVDVLREAYDGPITAYPDSGYFKMPDWQFDNIIPPDELVDYARGWTTQGVQVLGGCCGLSPEHIEALAGLRQ
ncbi:MAG: homocysteine S-methyltransferase family protein [Hyphomicrobiaceae bacterium]